MTLLSTESLGGPPIRQPIPARMIRRNRMEHPRWCTGKAGRSGKSFIEVCLCLIRAMRRHYAAQFQALRRAKKMDVAEIVPHTPSTTKEAIATPRVPAVRAKNVTLEAVAMAITMD